MLKGGVEEVVVVSSSQESFEKKRQQAFLVLAIRNEAVDSIDAGDNKTGTN